MWPAMDIKKPQIRQAGSAVAFIDSTASGRELKQLYNVCVGKFKTKVEFKLKITPHKRNRISRINKTKWRVRQYALRPDTNDARWPKCVQNAKPARLIPVKHHRRYPIYGSWPV